MDEQRAQASAGHGAPASLLGWLLSPFDSRTAEPTTAPLEPGAPAVAAGAVVDDRYEIAGVLGRGGMGVVYRAWDRRLRREVALKTLAGGSRGLERFLREARAVARLSSDGIVRLHDVREDGETPYFTMELLPGGSLEALLEREAAPLAPRRAAEIARPVALALQAAHDAGLVHRDVKPANVLFDATGRPVLTDFGLVRDASEAAGVTATGAFLGTAAYASPEHAVSAGEAGPASDQFSLGIVLYRMATGRLPFAGGSPLEQLLAIQRLDPVPPSRLAAVSRDLEIVIAKALEKAPTRRYASCRDLADDLGRFLAGEPVAARAPGRARAALRRWRHRPWRVAGLALALSAMVALLGPSLAPARIAIESDPAGAVVRLDGEEVGTTPLERSVWPARAVTVELRHPDCLPWTLRVDLSARARVERTFALSPREGRLTVRADTGEFVAALERSGVRHEWRGPFEERALPVGRWRLSVDRVGHFPFEAAVEVAEGRTTRVDLRPSPIVLSRHRFPVSIAGPVRLADVDRDGVLDAIAVLLAPHPGRVSIAALSGRGAFELWRAIVVEEAVIDLALSDLDRDGILDAVAIGRQGCHAVAGRDGSLLWTVHIDGWDLSRVLLTRVDEDRIPDAVFWGSRGNEVELAALSGADGRWLWSTPLDGGREVDPDPTRPAGRALATRGSLLFPIRGRGVVCLSGDGAVRWEHRDPHVSEELLESGGRIRFARRTGGEGVLDPESGSLVDEPSPGQLGGEVFACRPDGTIGPSSRRGWSVDPGGPLAGLELGDREGDGELELLAATREGELVWLALRERGLVRTFDPGRTLSASPILGETGAGGFPLALLLAVDGSFEVIDSGTGRPVEAGPRPSGRVVAASSADLDDDGRLEWVLAEASGDVSVWSASGEPRWTRPCEGEGAISIEAGSGLVLVTRGGRELVALDGGTGEEVWRRTTESRLAGPALLLGSRPRIAFATEDGAVIALDAASGTEVWRTSLPSRPGDGASACAIDSDDTQDVVLLLASGDLVAISGGTGAVLWTREGRFTSLAAAPWPPLVALDSTGAAFLLDEAGRTSWCERSGAVARASQVGWVGGRAIVFDVAGHAIQVGSDGRGGPILEVGSALRFAPSTCRPRRPRLTAFGTARADPHRPRDVVAGVLASGSVAILEVPEAGPSDRLWPLVENERWAALLGSIERADPAEVPLEALEGLARRGLGDAERGGELLRRSFEEGWRVPEAMAALFETDADLADRLADEFCDRFAVDAFALLGPDRLTSPAIVGAAKRALAGFERRRGDEPDPRRSLLLALAGRPAEALFDLDLLPAAETTHRDAVLVRALAYLLAGDPDHATEAWRMFVRARPADRVVDRLSARFATPPGGDRERFRLDRARSLAASDRLDEAWDEVSEYLRRFPEDPLGWIEEARVLLYDGRMGSAVEALRSARAAGFRDADRLLRDASFRAIRSRPELVERLRAE